MEALEVGAANAIGGGHAAQDVQDAIMKAVHDFVGSNAQSDDITLMVLVRDPEGEVCPEHSLTGLPMD
ncbi:MAG: hypothetical protein BWY25_02000 [Chloroflexi bacterium ADurb.Bin222]|nr:MAG: hypothetical protein BWY25_02000 [Chloroflexi bacterium ADurb.Bin222]